MSKRVELRIDLKRSVGTITPKLATDSLELTEDLVDRGSNVVNLIICNKSGSNSYLEACISVGTVEEPLMGCFSIKSRSSRSSEAIG